MFGDNVLKTGSNEMELVDFRIFKKTESKVYEGIYGVNVAKVREIIKMPNLTELPGVPEYIEGIFDLRGVVIPVVNLAKWMNIIEPTNEVTIKPRVIIAEFSSILIGFIVHEAKRIRRINWKDIEPANFSANAGALDKGKITGVTRIENDEVLLILDLESIVEELGIYSPKIEVEIDESKKLKGTALVLDDSSTARKLVKDALEKMGLNVVEAKNGVEGIERMNELYERFGDNITKEVRVILSDIEMPQMDGYRFASTIKDDERFRAIPIVFNSSLSNEYSEAKSKEAGGDAYITKFDASVFYQEVQRVIESHSQSAK
ncbi:chemotaxis protein [uncultured Campylobacter sp.]|jgi:ATP synthase gamma chain (ATP synthase F1 sector gammasubunit)|uniref:chemotaxis protein n=1 Tax=uncultured Campylobacter sp. TaxID=218934 RepID=UPI0025E729A9|nr:chemotaxis protein [uncultured Campylobacter sp.]